MTLDPGTRFGPYEVTGQIGAGGMGEVYRATDSKLGRDVAIKTLPEALATDKDRLARFEREAKLLASLNHPHIASIYSLDEHDGTMYLAMELIEGETLEEKLKAGPLPVEDALRLALQIAEALEAAHDKGVIHRDLKPANIMVTAEAQVKVLDFGLAKAFSGNSNEASPAHSPALSVAMTQAGLVLGTAGYMSPEQASGQGTDQRVDVWAFGVVLYEMLTGLPLFRGESVPHILADVLKTEPDWDRLPQNLHLRFTHLLERCLTKKPRSRLHSIADARIEIEAVLTAPEGVQPEASVAAVEAARPNKLRLIGAFVILVVAAALSGWFLRPVPAPEPSPVARFQIPLPTGQSLTADPVSLVAVSRDGTQIAYAADNQLYLRNLGDAEVRPIQGTEMAGTYGAAAPAFSPDGEWLTYVDVPTGTGPFTIMRVPTSGGTPVGLHEAQGLSNYQQGLSWPTPDTILFANAEGIVRMPANGGAVEVLIRRGEDERFDSPQLLPGGDAVLFTRTPGASGSLGGFDDAEIVVQSIGADDRSVVWPSGSAVRYLPTGHLVYAQGTALFAIAFDAATRTIQGGPVPLVDGLRRTSNNASDTANYAVSDTGTLVFLAGSGTETETSRTETTLSWVDREGAEEPLPVRPDDYTMVRISPDGTKAALVVGAHLVRTLLPTIWIYDFETENLSLLTTDPAVHDGPVWSVDSRRLFFRTPNDDGGVQDVYVIELESRELSLVVEGLIDGFSLAMPWSLSPREDTLTIINAQNATDVDFATIALPDGEFARALGGEGTQTEPSFSTDGAWLAYHETLPGAESEINIRPFPGLALTRIPVGPGTSPVFSRDGTELFFLNDNAIVAADVAFEPSLRVGTPRTIVETTGFMPTVLGRGWDPDPSGERFLLMRDPNLAGIVSGNEPQRLGMEVVLNWFEELKSRVPTE